MNTNPHPAALSILLATAILLSSCSYRYDRVVFNAVGKMSATQKAVPDIAIDTNDSMGALGGLVKSNKPYDIFAFYYMDNAPIVASVEFTKVTVTYADGTVDPGAKALNLPMRFKSFVYEGSSHNADGSVVTTKSSRIEAELPGAITRDEPFTLLIEGRFTKENGTTIPFTIKRKYDMERDKRTETLVDYVNNC
jgi:hypothetical protein